MAKGRTVFEFIHPTDDITIPTGTRRFRLIPYLVNYLTAFSASLMSPSTSGLLGQGGAKSTGTLTFASATGTVGGIINGVTITVTAAGGDTATAGLWVAAVTASTNPLVKGVVTAANVAGVATLTSVQYGLTSNAITLAASGTGVTASGARLTGGTSATFVTLTR